MVLPCVHFRDHRHLGRCLLLREAAKPAQPTVGPVNRCMPRSIAPESERRERERARGRMVPRNAMVAASEAPHCATLRHTAPQFRIFAGAEQTQLGRSARMRLARVICRSAMGPFSQSSRLAAVQSPVIPIVGEWIRRHPGTISLGQGVVHYGPPPQVHERIAEFYSGRSRDNTPRRKAGSCSRDRRSARSRWQDRRRVFVFG